MAPKCIALWIESLGGPDPREGVGLRKKGFHITKKPHRHKSVCVREIAILI
jgi:hypothetical protein